jgi:hypothetical protein
LQAASPGGVRGATAMWLLADTNTVVYQSSIGIGSIIAVVASWDRNRSILLAIIAAILSWLYVIYFAITREPSR